MNPFFRKIKVFIQKYERHISSAALIGGFILDSLTLRRIDLLVENLILFAYILIAGAGIIFTNLYAGGVWKGKLIERIHPFFPIIIQFAFGGLFSGFLVFYSRSASLIASWPFMIVLVGLLIGNELFKKYYIKLTFQISVYFFVLFSYFIFYIPVLINRMGDTIFLLSGAVSLVIIGIYFYILSRIVPIPFKESKKYIMLSVGSIFIIVNLFYFTNILPPIPLSLKDAGAYHKVTRTADGYEVHKEVEGVKSFFKRRQTIHVTSGEPVYVYSSVFAPTALNTNIVHHWQYYNEQTRSWTTTSRVSFSIVGGRDGGYRGYSIKTNTFTGLWRVNVETARGQIIGRETFKIERVDIHVPLEIEIRK
ncbi:MAG: DUF2914 domain-containing protein [bacterium]|nr:DUF2914 domain-containing protein [bacterium]